MCVLAKVQSHSTDSLLWNLHESYNITGSSGCCGCFLSHFRWAVIPVSVCVCV